MTLLEALFLGAFQGITEFLPVSSSGHLVLAEHFLGLQAEKLLPFDALLHLGSFCSLLILFHKQIWNWLLSLQFKISSFEWSKNDEKTANNRKLLFQVLMAALPVCIVGFLFQDIFESTRSLLWVGLFFIISAVAFWFAEKMSTTSNTLNNKAIGFVAILQIFALFAGISRSGICTAAAMYGGMNRVKATEFAFLVGLPVIGAATLYQMYKVFLNPSLLPPFLPSLIAFLTSLVVGYIVAKWLIRWFQNHSLRVFAVYLFILGLVCIFLNF